MDNVTSLQQIIDTMQQRKVLVVGDVMLDMYEHCAVRRISPEAPVPIATVLNDSCYLGGAGNVAHNIRALGAGVSLVGVVGDDRESKLVYELLNQNGIDSEGVTTESGRMTTLKKRIVSGTQQLLRVDREVTHDISMETEVLVCRALEKQIREHDVVVISDYCKGLLTDAVVAFIKEEGKKQDKKILVDSKNPRLPRYSGVHVIKPNKVEAELFSGEAFAHDYANLVDVGRRVSEELESNIVVTLGGDGMALFEGGQFLHVKTEALQVFDVSGAGDTVLAVLATAVAAGARLEEAVHLSNVAAGHVVSQLGTTVCDCETLRRRVLGQQGVL